MAESVNILGGGEPWTHPQFLQYLKQLDDYGTATVISTSGDLIDDERASAIGRLRHLRTITFSIDSPDPAIYQRIRGQSLERALRGMERTVEAVDDPDVVRIAAVVMRDNIRSLAGFPELLRKYSISQLILRGVVQMTPATRLMVPDYSSEERAILAAVRDHAEALGIEVTLLPTIPTDLCQAQRGDFLSEKGADFQASGAEDAELRKGPRTRVCLDPWEMAVVTRDGDVFPCECYNLQNAVGSIAARPFSEVWSGEAFAKVRHGILSGTNIGCRSCQRRALGYHPLNCFAAKIVDSSLKMGRTSRVILRNIGMVAWSSKYSVRLGTARPRDRMQSACYHKSWIAPNRVATHKEAYVAPGDVGEFEFVLSAPELPTPGESFQFLVENHCWLPNAEFRVCASD